MCWQCDSEEFDKVIVGEFYDNNGKRIRGIYTTVSDDALVININVLDRLLSGVKVLEGDSSGDMTLEEAEERFGKQIIEKYLSSHGVVDIFSLEEVDAAYGSQIIEKHSNNTSSKAHNASKDNQKKAVQASIEKRKFTQATIIKGVLDGMTKQEIEYRYDISRSTINRALKGLNSESFEAIWYKYKTSVFDGVDMKKFVDFKMCHCSYKEYIAKRHFDASVEIRHNMEKELKNIESNREVNKRLVELSKGLESMGFSPLSVVQGVDKAPATEDDYFSEVIALCNEPVKNALKPVVVKREVKEDDKFVEKYSRKPAELKLATLEPTDRKRPRVKACFMA